MEGSGEPLVITDHQQPVLEVRPYRPKDPLALPLLSGASASSPAAIDREGRPIELRCTHRLGVDRLAIAAVDAVFREAVARWRQPSSGLDAGRAALLEQEAATGCTRI